VPVDTAVCIGGVGMVVAAGWVFAHAYENQPFIEAFIPWTIITAIFVMVGVCIGWVIRRRT
jgi:mannitol-specific phosphotransferase system IIBC component